MNRKSLEIRDYCNIPSYATRIGDLFELFQNTIPEEFFIFDHSQAIAEEKQTMSQLVSHPAIMEQLRTDCSLDALFIEDDLNSLEGILKAIPRRDSADNELSELRTLSNLTPPSYKSQNRYMDTIFNRTNKLLLDLSYKNLVDESPEATDMLHDIFVTVLVYRPLNCTQIDLSAQSSYLQITQRLVLLGSQKLSDLKDAIRCPQDKVWLGDCSEALDDPTLHVSADKLYKSSYFFIENTFYDDMRHPDSCSLSQPVLEWIRSKPSLNTKGPFNSSKMEDTVLNDMKVYVGKPYHYVHQGNCEHLIFFSDLSLVDRQACQNPSAFPMLTGRNPIRSMRCLACKRLPCRWLVSNAGMLLPKDPCALCEPCLRLLVYDADGNKINNDIRVHKYCGEEVVVVG